MIIVVPDEMLPSWNTLYSGGHWSKRSEQKSIKTMLVLVAVRDQHPDVQPFSVRVDILTIFYMDGRSYDADNVCDKYYIDGLVQAGVLINDSRPYVRRAATQVERAGGKPRVEIHITEVQDG